MIEKNGDESVIETLRSKTEEIDINQYLKSRFGGYTKQSVLEYLNALRKQQQMTADTFHRNSQALRNEKEAVKKTNEALMYRLSKLESEYQNLSESMKSIRLEDSSFTAKDVYSLKGTNAVLEEDLKKSKGEKDSLEKKLQRQEQSIKGLNEKLEQSAHQVLAARELLVSEKQETKMQRDRVAELSTTVEEKLDEIKYLKGMQSERPVESLKAKVNDLTQQLSTQTEVIAKLNSGMSLKEKSLRALTAENETQKHKVNEQHKMVEDLLKQNEKLQFSIKTLTNQLQDEYKKAIDLIGEKSDITVEKLIAQRKLDEANSQISMLELEIQKSIKSEELKKSVE